YGNQHMAEDPELTNDGWNPAERPADFKAFGPTTNIDEHPETPFDHLTEVEQAYQKLSKNLDPDSKSMIENALNMIARHFGLERWRMLLYKLMNDVIVPFERGDKITAHDNLLDLDSEIHSMQA
ncbi:MAG TPA: hypothetical protein VD998_02650, partial [Verrucomicrobiae bacterium]|nr:hypothetical protein [Verrucomicrobiae bacterium]